MNSIVRTIKLFFSGYFSLVASIASIIGLIIVFVPNKNQDLIALLAFIIFLLIIIVKFFFVAQKFLQQHTESGYRKFATYVRFSTEDGKHISYVIQKYIQCKTLVMDEHVHEFSWTGSHAPIISSTQQEFKELQRTGDGHYDKAIFKFKTPLSYNDFAIVDIKMDLDDSDKKAKPFCAQRVTEKIQLLSLRIELKNVSKIHNARIMRKKINTPLDQEYKAVDFVPFDTHSRSYEYNLYNPEVGYSYKIDWSE